MSTPQPFRLHVDETVLADLRQRLDRVRWPDEAPGAEASQFGTDKRYLQELVRYWRETFNWRRQEEAINAFPQYTVPLAGIDLHFLHVLGVGPDPMPLVLSHGWPGSISEFHRIVPLLTDPARFGGDLTEDICALFRALR